MPDHRAELIMQRVTDLVTGLPITGSRVERARPYNVPRRQGASLSIYMGADNPLDNGDGIRNTNFIDSELSIGIVTRIKRTDDFEKILNQIRQEVHIALFAQINLGLAFVQQIIWQGSTEPNEDSESEKPVFRQQLNYAVRYRHSVKDPSK